MASIPTTRISLSPSSSNSNPNFNPKFTSRTSAFFSNSLRPSVHPLKKHHYHHNHHHFTSTPCCRCKKYNPSGESGGIRWNLLLQDAVQSAVKRCKEYLSTYWDTLCKVEEELEELSGDKLKSKENLKSEENKVFPEREEKKEEHEWSWERWKQHIGETEENERLLQALKLQLKSAVAIEDFNSAERLKQAISIARKYDFVGRAISDLNRAIVEERYGDATDIRDHAGAGLIGWWAGLSENASDPYGLIVRITAEYGRYVAKSYSSRQLTSSSPGVPLFEVYFIKTNGELKQQAVYIKPGNTKSSEFDNLVQKATISERLLSDSLFGQGPGIEDPNIDVEEKDSSDNPNILNLSQDDTLPRFKLTIFITSSGKIDGDHIAKIFIGQILDEDDDEEEENDDEENDDGEFESDMENLSDEEIGIDEETGADAEQEIAYSSKSLRSENEKVADSLVHIPARLERKDRFSFTLHIDNDEKPKEDSGTQQLKKKNAAVIPPQQGADLVLPDLVKLGSMKKGRSVKVMFRAKIGKQHQLPDKGLIPKELGVVARYKGRGCISGADIGFKSPQWVDGELLILDGKFTRDAPVIGFFYLDSNFQIVEFFSRLILPD
ncbi:protein EXECUTER 1 [Carex littledalei]|uniref:Protein EXECUTER 1 n=1 Tax=Carex littledalei TaxID=544730 RepID=A0A833QJU7_9POAL|nr:protein EXECUTER 1 [Carex littledalei]